MLIISMMLVLVSKILGGSYDRKMYSSYFEAHYGRVLNIWRDEFVAIQKSIVLRLHESYRMLQGLGH